MEHPDYFDTPEDIEEEEEEDDDEDDEHRRVTGACLPTTPLPPPEPLTSRVPAWDKSRKPNMEQTIAVLMHDKPTHLLELPVDILEAIIKEITHTNDLCSLAVTCSALHSLTIPHIYSRFDIVWPELAPQSDPRTGVDALTYGLSTLVMASEIFGESPHHSSHNQHPVTCTNCGHVNPPPPPPPTLPTLGHSLKPSPLARLKSRKGNHYALYTRKFSLGNGPKDWVQEYMLYKEAGKLLGTQVALAVARMRNLEQFIWDMPTGILREVWQALSSLEARGDGHPCKLERVWIRWHNSRQSENGEEEFNNMENSGLPGSVPATTSQVHLPAPATPLPETGSKYPTFSILPPLKSLGVVDIDELDYLEEMAVLIGRSRHCLRELRVGIARLQHAANISTASPVPAVGSATRQGHRLGGVMGLLFSHVFSVGPDGISRTPMSDASEQSIQRIIEQAATTLSSVSIATGVMAKDVGLSGNRSAETNAQPANDGTKQAAGRPTKHSGAKFVEDLPRINTDKANKSAHAQPAALVHEAYEDRLVLQILELERVPLSVFTLKEAIDWTRLREITLLDCAKHESLWKSLRRQYGPSPSAKHTTWQTAGGASSMASASKLPRSPKVEGFSYPLRIRKIHTNTVSIALLSFINQALPPNSLEVLFLQMSSETQDPSAVSVEQIYKGPLRRHRESLRKLSIDSTKKSADGKFDGNSRWQHWMVSRTVLDFITSGKMPRLRELCICIDRADWHHFLQRMPFMPHLRALYIPFLTRDIEDQQLNDKTTRELAQQILNIVVLRPEVELCYLGLFNKCYEILEGKWAERDAELHLSGESSNDDDDDDDFDDEEEDDDDDHDGDDGDDDASHDSDDDDDLEHADSHDEDSDVEMGESRIMVRLREILFYDDKVAIFKARHGRL